MTCWTFKKSPVSPEILMLKQDEGQPLVILGKMKDLHNALTEVANFFEPGDLIITPEGSCFMSDLLGELNN